MHWAYEYAEKLKNRKKEDGKDSIVVAAGTSPSGTVHIGNFRDIVTAYFIVKALKEQGEDAKLLFSWDDYDKFRKVPKNIPDEKMYKIIDTTLEEKEKILREIVERRYTVIENRKDRKHYRKKLGEIRFGEKGQGLELNKFYEMIDSKENLRNE